MVANTGSAHGTPALIRLWMLATAAAPGLLERRARQAHRQQGAEPSRLPERLGRSGLLRPPGPLIWLHAASVGEVTSITRLGKALMAASPERSLLVTTATRTGAETVARLLPGALHQFLPVDTPAAARSFLDHWRPDAALFVEADLWPRLIFLLQDRGCPMALLNARHSRSRERFPRVYAALLSRMALITAQDPALLPGLAELGLDQARLRAPGNLKADLAPQEVDVGLCDVLTTAATGRVIWAAVSTHAPEEELILQVHAGLPDAPLLVLVPRHPERGDAVADLLHRHGLSFTRHSRGTQPGHATRVHLVDTVGLTGTIYAATGLACIGGSLVPGIGGHTPYEPAALGCAILSGRHVGNFSTAYRDLVAKGAACLVTTRGALEAEVARLLQDREARKAMQLAARAFYTAQTGASEATLELLAPILP